MECILLSHVFIEDEDINKINQVNFSAKHFRRNNPNSYIIALGHGTKPNEIDNYCDYVYWENKIIRSEIGRGHPYLVNKGISHAEEKRFPYILKTRIDGINLIPNIFTWCLENIRNFNFLTTQITCKKRLVLCDLFNFSKTEIMKKIWEIDNWNYSIGGHYSLAKNFQKYFTSNNWQESIRNNCRIIDIYNLKWIDFRNNWELLKSKKCELLNNSLEDYTEYLWGSSEGWLIWDKIGNLIESKTWDLEDLYTEKFFLNTPNIKI